MMMIHPVRLSSATATVVAVLILTVAIWAESGGAAGTLEVSNERNLPEKYIYVRCSQGSKQDKPRRIAPKKVAQIKVGSGLKDGNEQQLAYICTGTYTEFYGMGATPYYIYSSKNYGDGSFCRVMANETSFYRWDAGKEVWDIIPPSPWVS